MYRGKRHIFEPQLNVQIDFNLKLYGRVLQPKEISYIFEVNKTVRQTV